jgi:hypothetical protein
MLLICTLRNGKISELSCRALKEMPRFYFNILSEAGSLDDWEGTELPDLAAARIEAVHDARALMSSAVLLGYDIASRSVEIRNETGDILLVLPFSEAVKRVG